MPSVSNSHQLTAAELILRSTDSVLANAYYIGGPWVIKAASTVVIIDVSRPWYTWDSCTNAVVSLLRGVS